MKVKFRHSETGKEHKVLYEYEDHYILDAHPMNWSSDCKVSVKKQAVEIVPEPPVYYRIGQRFHVDYANDVYLLAQSEPNMCLLIGLTTGNQWTRPIKVKDSYAITSNELARLADSKRIVLVGD